MVRQQRLSDLFDRKINSSRWIKVGGKVTGLVTALLKSEGSRSRFFCAPLTASIRAFRDGAAHMAHNVREWCDGCPTG